ncbi:MAG: hypothetical protein GEEBNDBF_00250 [bacterium]|nr:hypothetical protein [bacterium]
MTGPGYHLLMARRQRRGATMLEYAMLTILLTGVLAWSLRAYTPPLIRATLTRFNQIFSQFPN